MCLSVKHFRHFVEERNFVFFISCSSLCEFRHLDFVGRFTTDIRHVCSKEKVITDTPSRVDDISFPNANDYVEFYRH